jgi:dolichol-phosphate mannosyltransferase
MHNEEDAVGPLLARLEKVLDGIEGRSEVVFVNDGSTDRTADVLRQARSKDPRIKIVHFTRNFGHQRAITAALDFAEGDACVIMDGDLQDPPELIPQMLDKWKQGFEVVYAVRAERQGETWLKRLTAHAFYRFINVMSEVPIPTDTGDFRLVDRKVVLALRAFQERGRFLRGLVNWVGFKQTAVTFVRESRISGKTKFSMSRMIRFAVDGITSFSVVPLQVATTTGLLVSAGAFVYALTVLYARIVTGEVVSGWSSLMIALLFFSGIQLVFLGLLGEYVGRIYNEVKARPLYLVRDLEGFDELS